MERRAPADGAQRVAADHLGRATHQADAELSEQQAQRDIREMVRASWLAAKGEAQGRYYTAGPDLPEDITHGVREPRQLRDPYAGH
ncbi:hypothetical protein [Kitasatospora griseola]|uniref:hypothetical protein n=1 Tax=Kitasatospora griseola TaxID=2064 RepID=UPI003824D81E